MEKRHSSYRRHRNPWAWSLAFLCAGFLAPLAFGEVTAETYPSQVTVFPDGARVTRQGSLELKGGAQQVVFQDLPASVVESSLRLTVEGPLGTKLYGVSLRQDHGPEVIEKRTRVLKERLQALEDQKTDLNDRVEARKTEIELLKELGKEGSKTAANQAPTRSQTLVDFTLSAGAVGKRLILLQGLSRKDERMVRVLDLKITALNEELTQSGTPDRDKRTAEADLDLPKAGNARFTLTYQVANASWTPLYDLRLATEGAKPSLALDFNASIRQKTGEDWKGVTLTLSTAHPTEGTQVPDPTDWWLDFIDHPVQVLMNRAAKLKVMAATPAANGQFFGTADANEDGEKNEEQAPAEVVTAQTVQSAYTMTFVMPVPRDIPSDGSDHRVGVAQSSHPVDLTLVVVPRLSQAAYLEAKVTYGGEQVLLPGAAQLFRDGDFVGSTYLQAKATGESFELGFGQDEQVQVERKLLKNQQGEAGGFFDMGKGERQYQWVTTLANYHSGVRTLVVREQLPRSREKDITVTGMNMNPKPLVEDADKPGLVQWKLTLKPKEKTKLTFAYQVKFPSGTEVTGLE